MLVSLKQRPYETASEMSLKLRDGKEEERKSYKIPKPVRIHLPDDSKAGPAVVEA